MDNSLYMHIGQNSRTCTASHLFWSFVTVQTNLFQFWFIHDRLLSILSLLSLFPCVSSVDQPQPSFLWRLSSGAVGGVYNVATGAAGMGFNGTKWVLGEFVRYKI